jgi:hypothetical protein
VELTFVNDNELYYCELYSDEVRRLNLVDFKDEAVFKVTPGIRSMRILNEKIATLSSPASDGESCVQLWDLRTHKEIWKRESKDKILSLEFTSDGHRLIATTSTGRFDWRVDNGQRLDSIFRWIPKPERGPRISSWAHPAFHDNQVAVPVSDCSVEIFDINSGKHVQTLRPGGNSPADWKFLEFSSNGEWLIAIYLSGNIELWNPKTGSNWHQENLPMQWHAEFTRDGKALLTTADDGFVTVRDIPSLEPRFRFPRLGAAASNPTLSPSGRWLAVSGTQGELQVWDIHSEHKN